MEASARRERQACHDERKNGFTQARLRCARSAGWKAWNHTWEVCSIGGNEVNGEVRFCSRAMFARSSRRIQLTVCRARS